MHGVIMFGVGPSKEDGGDVNETRGIYVVAPHCIDMEPAATMFLFDAL